MMEPDDPFFSPNHDDRTIIRPVPGGRRADLRQTPLRPSSSTTETDTPLPKLGRLNPLERAASGLLALITRINNSPSYPDPGRLKSQLTREINSFQNDALHNGIDQQTVQTARYVLCTTLDEAVLNTPWGHASGWAQQSLLSNFHKEVSGGERFFNILKALGQNASKNINLLELMYLCLALGFEGRYRITQGGKDRLQEIQHWLYQLISNQRTPGERTLSPHWKGVIDKRHPLLRFIPIWVIGTVASALLAALFFAFLIHLNRLSDPVFQHVYSIKAPTPQAAASIKPLPAVTPDAQPTMTLSKLLSAELNNGELDISESATESKVTLRGDSLFRSGHADVNKTIIPLLHKVGRSLNQLSGTLLITGHSDSDPIKTARFPSNWHLSQARADAVSKLIREDLDDPQRITAEGRADLEPITSNDTPEDKAQNRRVEIMQFK
jgi:type VI secretion system protein ImpK